MGYYQGDFYRGYRGDPGFFSFLGGLAKKAVGIASHVLPGPAGAVAKAVSSIGSSPMVKRGVQAVQKHPVLSAAGAAGTMAAGAAGVHAVMGGSPAAAGKAMHAARMAHAGGRRHRRMNPGNFRALRRSLRRISAFDRAARKVLHYTHPHRSLGRPVFKFKRKRKR